MSPSVPLPSDADLTEEARKTLATLPPLHVFRMMANAPASLRPFLDLAGSILIGSEFDARKREIAVLRVAHVTGSSYEWTQHERLGRNLGLEAAEIDAIAADGPVTGLDEEGRLLCRVADEISRDVRLSDEALSAIMARYGVRQATELIVCCSYFNMLSRFLESTRVELEADDLIGDRIPGEVAGAAGSAPEADA
ncbi:MAG: carboxymuconolactone decarboxylase family protein [Deltaproteobacteria bacterium]|nr:carboxymuconolactone decarboxylase family protein [Deltaproteobacteria bacterium]MBW2396020.1 carboxymuconolactone decarboxylase family protein [Deltaproteobacteria bacterium]